MFCTNCGHRNPKESNFCAVCGQPLLAGETGDTTLTFLTGTGDGEQQIDLAFAMEDLQPGQGMLVVTRGPNAGSTFVLDGEVVRIGRHPDSDIFLDDITVSRRHAELQRSGAGYLVKDAASLNGTYVNRERVDDARLSNGDEVQVGKFRLVYFARTA
jgi:pSer/pThr/pTyr-binding forkhead associated (FHA) protein